MGRSLKLVVACVAACLVVVPAASAETTRYILPPGNFGGLPTTQNSLDQLPLYDGLTPLRGNVTPADVDSYYLPEDFNPIGATRDEPTGRAGLRIVLRHLRRAAHLRQHPRRPLLRRRLGDRP